MQCGYYDAGRCRSCTLLATPYLDQLTAKTDRARQVLPGLTHWADPVPSAPAGFRNKAKLVVAGTSSRPTLGILDPAGRGVDLRRCALYEAAIVAAQPVLAAFVSRHRLVPYDVPRRRGELKYLLLTASPTGDLMLRIVLRSPRHVDTIRAGLPRLRAELPGLRVVSVNLHPEHKAVLEGDEELLLTEQTTLVMPVGDVRLHLGVRSFFQTNTAVAAALYRQAAAWVDELAPATVWDLFCGVGGFALSVAAPGRAVLGVELSADAVTAARRAATELGLPSGQVRFRAGDAGSVTDEPAPEAVVVNPPRRGLGQDLARWLDASPTRHVLYSSCNIESLRRDLAVMPGFVPVRARVFDMFPHTGHFEVLVQLTRVRTDVPEQ